MRVITSAKGFATFLCSKGPCFMRWSDRMSSINIRWWTIQQLLGMSPCVQYTTWSITWTRQQVNCVKRFRKGHYLIRYKHVNLTVKRDSCDGPLALLTYIETEATLTHEPIGRELYSFFMLDVWYLLIDQPTSFLSWSSLHTRPPPGSRLLRCSLLGWSLLGLLLGSSLLRSHPPSVYLIRVRQSYSLSLGLNSLIVMQSKRLPTRHKFAI